MSCKEKITMKQKTLGFTLIELMISVAIVGILSAIAYPNYISYLERGRRTVAQGDLLAFANAMEQYYVQNGSDYRAAGGVAPNVYTNTVTIDGVAMYSIAVTSITASAYTLRATPNANTAQTGNGFVQIDNTGARSWDAPSGLINHW